MAMQDEGGMTNEGARLLNFLENKLRGQDYLEVEKMLRRIIGAVEDQNGLPQPGGAMDRRIAMDARSPGAIVAAREQAIEECQSVLPRHALLACDSAEEVFREALRSMGSRAANSVHASALPALFRETRRNQAGIGNVPDARSSASFNQRFPNAARIKTV